MPWGEVPRSLLAITDECGASTERLDGSGPVASMLLGEAEPLPLPFRAKISDEACGHEPSMAHDFGKSEISRESFEISERSEWSRPSWLGSPMASPPTGGSRPARRPPSRARAVAARSGASGRRRQGEALAGVYERRRVSVRSRSARCSSGGRGCWLWDQDAQPQGPSSHPAPHPATPHPTNATRQNGFGGVDMAVRGAAGKPAPAAWTSPITLSSPFSPNSGADCRFYRRRTRRTRASREAMPMRRNQRRT